ncbi:MAG: hypothetical protein ABI855_20075, partial [Bacteroidota bacterium]
MVAPMLLLADLLSYVGDPSYIIHEYFNAEPMSDRLVIRAHKTFFKKEFEEFHKIDHDSFLESFASLRKIKHPDRIELIAIQRGKKLINAMKKDVEGYFEHYSKQWGFHVFGPFLKEYLKLVPNDYSKYRRSGSDEYLDHFHQLLTETNQIAAVTDEFDLVMDVQIIRDGDTLPESAGAIVFPLFSFPVLKRLTEEQFSSLFKDMRNAAASFNVHLKELNEHLREISFSGENFNAIYEKSISILKEDKDKIPGILTNHVYIQQLRNSYPEEGEVQIFAGITSISKFLDAYEKLGIFESYSVQAIL